MTLTDIGNGNLVNSDRIVSIVAPDSMPIRRLVQDSKDAGRAIDVSCGKKICAVVITDCEYIVLSAESINTLRERISDDTK